MYRVVVRGRLTPAVLENIDGFVVDSTGEESVLIGIHADQADLHGLLLNFQRFGIQLLSVGQVNHRA